MMLVRFAENRGSSNTRVHSEFSTSETGDHSGSLDSSIREVENRAAQWDRVADVLGYVSDRMRDARIGANIPEDGKPFPGDVESKRVDKLYRLSEREAKRLKELARKQADEARSEAEARTARTEAKTLRDIERSTCEARDKSAKDVRRDNERAEKHERWDRSC